MSSNLSTRPTLIILLLVTLTTTFPSAQATEAPAPLEPGSSVERTLSAGESHTFQIQLDAGMFLQLAVDQRGIDVIVSLNDPEGQGVLEIDQTGKDGPESAVFFSEVQGIHQVEITPFDEEAEPGRYALEVLRLEKAADSPADRVGQIMSQWDSLETPGASVIAMRDGKVLMRRGFGSAQLEYNVPISPSTIFHVASVSKQFTAYAAALLAAEGRLSLDDDVRKHIPEVPDFGKTITLRHLIHHTSGLRDQWNLLAMGGWRLDDVITLEQIMTAVEHQEELNFDPGEEMVYCNTGYTLLAEVVARVTGQSFRQWTAENIFEPLGMNHTHFHDDHEMIVPGRAYSYRTEGSDFKKSVLSYANVGATSLFTTVDDLARWMANLDRGTLGGEAVRDQVHQRGKLNSGKEVSYAFALVHGEHRGLPTVSHGGGDAGFRSQTVRYPDQGFAVAVLSNLGNFNPGGVARQIAELYLKDEMDAAEAELEKETEAAAKDKKPASNTAVAADILETYVGQYRLDAGLVISVMREEDKLFAQPRGQSRVTLVPVSETEFRIAEVDARLEFHRGGDGKSVDRIVLFQHGLEMPGERVKPFEPTAEILARYVGNYYSPELGTFYQIKVQDDGLQALHRRHGKIKMTPIKEDEFSTDAWYFGQVRFERDEGGGVTGLRASSGRVRNVRFERQ